MKKQTNLHTVSRKLSLNKKTISNLSSSEMNQIMGGAGKTQNGNTCRFTCRNVTTCHCSA